MRFLRFLLKPRPAQLGVLSMLFVSGVALYVASGPFLDLTFSCTGGVIRGANIETALGVAFFGGLAGAVVIALARRSGYLLAVALFLGAAVPVAALALVAADSATFIQDNGHCGFSSGTGTSTGHFGYLYVLWGVPLIVLLFAAGWALRNARRSSSSKPQLRKPQVRKDIYGLLHPKPDDEGPPG